MKRVSRCTFLQITGATAAAAMIAACAPAPTGGGDEQAAPSAEDVELSLAMVDYVNETKTALDETLLPAFEAANEGITVKVNYSSWERYNEEMTTAFAGGVTPDVFQGGAVWAPQMAKRGWSLPLDDFIASASEGWDWDDYFPALQDDVTIEGQVVAVPYRMDVRSFWYRDDQLAEAGFDTPPTNWEELEEVAVACTQRDGDQVTREGFHFLSPGGWQNDLQSYMQFMEMAGGQFMSDDLTHCTLNEEPAIEALEYVRKLIVDLQVQPYPGFESQGDLEPMTLGLASSTVGAAQIERNAAAFAPEELEHLIVTLPLSHEVQATHVWVNKFFMSSMTKHANEGWALLENLTSQSVSEDYCATGGFTPPRRSVGEADFMTDRMKVLLASAEFAVPYPKYWRLIETFRPFATNLEKCLRDEMSPEDTMAQTCEAIDKIMQETPRRFYEMEPGIPKQARLRFSFVPVQSGQESMSSTIADPKTTASPESVGGKGDLALPSGKQ